MNARRLLVGFLAAAWCDVSAAETPAPASRWGLLPPPADSVTATFRDAPTPLWEKTLLVPYRIVALPFRGVSYGIGASLVYFDDHHVIYRVSQLLGPRKGPFGVLVNFTAGGLPGFGGGLTIVHDAFLAPQNRFKFRFQSTVKGSHKITLGMRFGDGRDGRLEVGAGYRLRPNARHFGIGPASDETRESFYKQELTWVGTTVRGQLAGDLAVEAGALFSTIGARGSDEDDSPSVSAEFAGEAPPGYRERSDGVGVSLGLRHDTASEEGRPTRGGLRRVNATYFESVDGSDVSFWTYRGEIEEFFPLWFSYRALAVRGFLSWIEPAGDSSIPFQRMMTNDDPDLLRGYQDFRWRDRGMTALSLEYRWPLWANREADGFGLDAYLLADYGQVFGELHEIGFRTLTDSYGGGIRIASFGGFLGRAEIARSDEETVFRLRADQIFQFARGGLYHGRDPVPSR